MWQRNRFRSEIETGLSTGRPDIGRYSASDAADPRWRRASRGDGESCQTRHQSMLMTLDIPHRLDNQIGKTRRIQLFSQHKADIRDGFVADTCAVRDLTVRHAIRDHAQNFLL